MEHSILSAGTAIYELLTQSLGDSVTKVFPIAADEATLPYICYHRDKLESIPYKGNGNYTPPTLAEVSVDIYAATYKESVRLAEAVRRTLETWANDAFVQSLVFRLRI